jgi:hypothetical protein
MVTNNAWNSQDPAQIAKGGTGRATLTANNVITGDGTNPVNQIAPSATSGVALISQGAASQPTFGTVVVAGGGTGRTSLTQYSMISGDGTNQVNLIAPSSTSGVPLISQGTASQPTFGTAVVAGGGTGNTSATAYAVICGGTTSTGAFQSIASVGSAGEVLTSNGAGALPTFQPAGAGSGSLVYITTKTASNSASIIFDNTEITSTYQHYVIYCYNVVPVTDNVYFYSQVSSDNGSSWINSGYYAAYVDGSAPSTTFFPLTVLTSSNRLSNLASSGGYIGEIHLMSLTTSSTVRITGWGAYPKADETFLKSLMGGRGPESTTVNAIRFLLESGNISTGTFKLYGISA